MVCPVLVGRTQEIEQLIETAKLSASGEGRIMLVSGEAGMGKSRLLEEVEHRLDENWSFLQGHCYEQESSFPYSPWIDALRGFLGRYMPGKSELPRSPSTFPGRLSEQLVQLLPELQSNVPLKNLLNQRNPENEKQVFFNAILAWMINEARVRPVLLALEDIHWSDQASLDLLRYIVRHIAHTPVTILATYRSDEIRPALAAFLSDMDRERRAGEVVLKPLARSEVEQMIGWLLGLPPGSKPGLPESLYTWMEGNPLYVEEILQSLINANQGILQPNQWTRSGFDPLVIPRSVQETVQQRAEKLSQGARSLLTLAAVIGQQFDGHLLKRAAQIDEAQFLPLVRELIDAQLVVEMRTDRGEASDAAQTNDLFAFRHALTREAIYSTLLGLEKRILHERIAQTYKTAPSAGHNPYLSELTYHYYEAGNWSEALQYAQLAGERAQSLYAPREAVLHFSRALDAARQLNRPAPVICLMGRAYAYNLLGDFDRTRADYETALAAVQDHPEAVDNHLSLKCRLLIQLGFLWHSRDYRRSGAYFQQALEFAQQQPDPTILAHTFNRVGNWQMNQNHPFEAREYHELALEIFERLQTEQGIGETLDLLGITHYQCGNMLRGKECFEQAIQLWQRLGARQNLLGSMVRISFPSVVETEIEPPIDIAAQRSYGETALGIAREVGWRSAEADAYATLSNLSNVGAYDRALEDALAGLEIAQEIGHSIMMAQFYSRFGEYYLDLVHLPEAREALDQSLRIARHSGAELLVCRSTALLALVHIRAGRLEDAETLLNEAIPKWQPRQSVFVRQNWRAKAELRLKQRLPAEALRIVDQLIETAENGPARGERSVPVLAWLRGEALAAIGDWSEAESELSTAVEQARSHNRFPLVWRAQISLGKVYLAHKRPDQAAQSFENAREFIEHLAGQVPEALRENFRKCAFEQIPDNPRYARSVEKKKRPGGLTDRELEVAALIARGKTNREIAEELVIGVRTVEAHITRILARLNFTSRTEVAVWAAANGLVR